MLSRNSHQSNICERCLQLKRRPSTSTAIDTRTDQDTMGLHATYCNYFKSNRKFFAVLMYSTLVMLKYNYSRKPRRTSPSSTTILDAIAPWVSKDHSKQSRGPKTVLSKVPSCPNPLCTFKFLLNVPLNRSRASLSRRNPSTRKVVSWGQVNSVSSTSLMMLLIPASPQGRTLSVSTSDVCYDQMMVTKCNLV